MGHRSPCGEAIHCPQARARWHDVGVAGSTTAHQVRRRRSVLTLTVTVAAAMGLSAPPVAAHDCGAKNAKPSCVDRGVIFIQKPAQIERSRPLGHYCEDGKEVLTTRIEVSFRNVTRHAGHLQKITVYFDGDRSFHLGALDAYGPKNEFHYQDHRTDYPPGSTVSFHPDKKVDLGDGSFVVQHKPWKGMVTGSPAAPRSAYIPCSGPPHQFLLQVREHREKDPCRGVEPPGPC